MYARFQRGLRRCKDRLMLQGRGVGKGHTNGSASCLEASTPRSGSNDISAAINRHLPACPSWAQHRSVNSLLNVNNKKTVVNGEQQGNH